MADNDSSDTSRFATQPSTGEYQFPSAQFETIHTRYSRQFPAPICKRDMRADEKWQQPPASSYPDVLIRPENAQDTDCSSLSVRPRVHAAFGNPVISFEVEAKHGAPSVVSNAWSDITAILTDYASKLSERTMQSTAWQQADRNKRSMTDKQVEAVIACANELDYQVARELCSRPSIQGVGSVIMRGPRMLIDAQTQGPISAPYTSPSVTPVRTRVDCSFGLDAHGFDTNNLSDERPADTDQSSVFIFPPLEGTCLSHVFSPKWPIVSTASLQVRPLFYYQAGNKVGVQWDVKALHGASSVVGVQWSLIESCLADAARRLSTAIENDPIWDQSAHDGRLLSPRQALHCIKRSLEMSAELGETLSKRSPTSFLNSIELAHPGVHTDQKHVDEIGKLLDPGN